MVVLRQSKDRCDMFFSKDLLVATYHSICIHDNADVVQNKGAFDANRFKVPFGIKSEASTYLGGSRRFMIKEIEVF